GVRKSPRHLHERYQFVSCSFSFLSLDLCWRWIKPVPDVAAIAPVIGPDGDGAADNVTVLKRSEITTIETVRHIGIHEEYLLRRQRQTSLPIGQGAASAAVSSCLSNDTHINSNRVSNPADSLARKGGNMLDQRHTCRHIAAVCQKLFNLWWRRSGQQITDAKLVHFLHGIKPHWHARTRVPDKAARHCDRWRYGNCANSQGCCEEDCAPFHGNNALRPRYALWRVSE